MLLSDLLGSVVVDPDGGSLGRVVDARFRRTARHGRSEGDLELIALIVSPRSRLSFYGYERGSVDRPVAIARIIEWLHRRSRVIPWECVARVEAERIVLGVRPPEIPLDARRPLPE
jgi:sporulation protein YlmC with PRC-barrel domain